MKYTVKHTVKYIFLVLVLCLSALQNGNAKQVISKKKLAPPISQQTVTVPLKDEANWRVDPHGKVGQHLTLQMVKDSHDCTICHQIQGEAVITKAKAEETCSNCHNKAPHSGVEDHLKYKITCISCHSFHRSDGKMMTEPSGLFRGLHAKITTEGFIERTKPNAMIRKDCTECHKWLKQ